MATASQTIFNPDGTVKSVNSGTPIGGAPTFDNPLSQTSGQQDGTYGIVQGSGGEYIRAAPDLPTLTNEQSGAFLGGSSAGGDYAAWRGGSTYDADIAAANAYLASHPAPPPTPAPVRRPATPIVTGGAAADPTLNLEQYQATQLGTPTAWNVSADQTVEGRIAAIINPENPLMKQVAAQAKDEAAGRGLSNTSMAVTAGESAMLGAATPIATADAATFAKAAGYNADMANQFAAKNADFANQFSLAKMNYGTQYALAQLSANVQRETAQLSANTQLSTAQLNSETQKTIAGMNIDAQAQANQLQQENQTLLQTNSQAAQAFNTAMSAINNIQNNNQMDAATKTQAIAQVWADVQTQLRVLGSVAGLDLTGQLNFANHPGFDASGNYVGFQPNSADAGATFPPTVNGSPVNWDAPGNNGVTLRQTYDQYKAGGGTLSPEQWLLSGAPIMDAGGNGNGTDGSNGANGVSGDSVGNNANGDAAGVGAGPR